MSELSTEEREALIECLERTDEHAAARGAYDATCGTCVKVRVRSCWTADSIAPVVARIVAERTRAAVELAEPAPCRHDAAKARMESLIEASSLGTPEAKAARDECPPQVARLIVRCAGLMRERDQAVERAEAAEARLRDLTRRLEFGDGVTEPQAPNDVIVAWVDRLDAEAREWQESQRWRDECHAAGHPDDEDCWEHDPGLQLMAAEAKVARVEALLGQHWDWKAGRALYAAVRQALDADPAPSTGPLSDDGDGRGQGGERD